MDHKERWHISTCPSFDPSARWEHDTDTHSGGNRVFEGVGIFLQPSRRRAPSPDRDEGEWADMDRWDKNTSIANKRGMAEFLPDACTRNDIRLGGGEYNSWQTESADAVFIFSNSSIFGGKLVCYQGMEDAPFLGNTPIYPQIWKNLKI